MRHAQSAHARRRRRIATAVVLVVTIVSVITIVVTINQKQLSAPSQPLSSPTIASSDLDVVPASPTASAATHTPSTPAYPAAQECDARVATMLTVWAHPDDDIIFANPTISSAIAAGQCVRSVFLTAGDAGRGMQYVMSRERGILRAYNNMRGSTEAWNNESVTLKSGARVNRFTPNDSSHVSVLFLRLPDGNINGDGFASTGHATIAKLIDGDIDRIAPVDGGPAIDAGQLERSITELAETFQPGQILTHIPRDSVYTAGDHPDHSSVGSIVRKSAGTSPEDAARVHYFVGYPSESMPPNVAGSELDRKVDTYRLYAAEDSVIRCADWSACLATRRFGDWLRRSYPKTNAELLSQ